MRAGRAAELKEYEGDLMSSVSLYMRAGMPAKAARLISNHQVTSGPSLGAPPLPPPHLPSDLKLATASYLSPHRIAAIRDLSAILIRTSYHLPVPTTPRYRPSHSAPHPIPIHNYISITPHLAVPSYIFSLHPNPWPLMTNNFTPRTFMPNNSTL